MHKLALKNSVHYAEDSWKSSLILPTMIPFMEQRSILSNYKLHSIKEEDNWKSMSKTLNTFSKVINMHPSLTEYTRIHSNIFVFSQRQLMILILSRERL